MELILLESVAGLGRPGDQVKVKTGYARNFLLPQGKATPVNKEVLRGLDKLKARAEEEERALVSSMEELKGKLDGQQLTLNARATEEGHLFGSVSDRDVQEALEAADWPIPPRSVRMEHHIKEAGTSDVEVHLYGEISATVSVEVVPIDAEGNPIEIFEPEDEDAAAEGEAGDGGAAEASDDSGGDDSGGDEARSEG